MHDFPPTISAWTPGSSQAPHTASPSAYLRWLLGSQKDLVLMGCLFSVVWSLPAALTPWIFGRAIDQGIVPGDGTRLMLWAALLLVVTLGGAAVGVFYHTVTVRSWLVAAYGQIRLVTNKSTQLGHIQPRRVPTGEALSVSGSDGETFGELLVTVTYLFGNVVSYLVVAVIVLQMSLPMGALVLLVAPLLVAISSVLLRPLTAAQTRERSRDSELTSIATDIVAGLRILRGIGGERIFGDNYARQSQLVRHAGVRAGAWGALSESAGVLLSGLFVVLLMALGVEQVRGGILSVGELVTFLGYSLFLVHPIRVVFFSFQRITRAWVSARKSIGLLDSPAPWPTRERVADLAVGDLVDTHSGLHVRPGDLTMVVCAQPDEAAALADRLGRYLSRSEKVNSEDDTEATGRAARLAQEARQRARRTLAERDTRAAHADWGVTLAGVDLARLPLEQVRRTILVSDTDAHVFAGTLQEAVDPHGVLDRQQAEAALHAAAAEDVFEIMPGGWQGRLDERGRGLSGGQRQRLVLTRALAADPPVLVLVEPTSAVDAHTEALIAARLPRRRRGRTTVVVTVSPLLLHQADEIAFLENGRVVARGSHDDLLAHDAYRRVVHRGEEVAL